MSSSKGRISVSSNVISGLIVALDATIILASAIITFFTVTGGHVTEPQHYGAAIGFVWLTTLMLFNFGGLYRFEAILRPLVYVDRMLVAFATTFLFMLAAAFSLKISSDFSRVWTIAFAASATVATIFARSLVALVFRQMEARNVFSRNLVLLGAGAQAAKVLSHINATKPRFTTVLGVFTAGEFPDIEPQYPILGSEQNLLPYVRGNRVDDVIICLPWSAEEKIMELMGALRELPVNVYLASDLIGFRLGLKTPPDHYDQMPMVEVMGRPLAGWGGLQKAVLDYVLGTIILIITLPLMLLIALAVKLDSPGPVLFRQDRYGFVNRVFSCYKFRTMRIAGPEKQTVQATRDDPRVTRVGWFLRRFSLDELPQLLNVLGGTMSLVGPRPHAVDHNEKYAQLIRGYFARHRVKPGLTGWAQVNGYRGETRTLDAMEGRVKYDILYVENWSLLFDLKIIAMTLVVCLTGRNAY
jgi:Undecaprenyl-phosphate glucose phosphotransferase